MINCMCILSQLKRKRETMTAQVGIANSCFIDFLGLTIPVVFNGKILAFALLAVLEWIQKKKGFLRKILAQPTNISSVPLFFLNFYKTTLTLYPILLSNEYTLNCQPTCLVCRNDQLGKVMLMDDFLKTMHFVDVI